MVVDLPVRFAVTSKLLDCRFSMNGLSVPCELLLPRAGPIDESRIPVLGPPSGLSEALARNMNPASAHGFESWGEPSSSIHGHVLVALINSAVIEFDTSTKTGMDEMRQLVETLRREIAVWFDSFCHWLGVLGRIVGVDIDRSHQWFTATYALGERDGKVEVFSALTAFGGTYLEAATIEPATWERALALTNRGAAPHLSHLRLLEARSNMIRGDHRAVVIDACTAAEVALSTAIRGRFPLDDTQAVDALIDGTSGVVALSDLARALGVDVPVERKEIVNQIGNRRNRAVHRAHVSSREGARLCLDLCAQVVNAAAPLPEP